MALQKTITTKGNVPITDAIIEVKEIVIKKEYSKAEIYVCIYKDTNEQSANNSIDSKKYIVTGSNFTTYFNTADGSNTILDKAQDYLKNEIADYSEATEI